MDPQRQDALLPIFKTQCAVAVHSRTALELMSPVTIFVKETPAVCDLTVFASRVSEALGSCALTERESSNFAHGHYYTGWWGTAEVEAYYLDTEGLEQYLFVIEIAGAQEDVAHTAAQTLAKVGFTCFVPAGAWYRKSWNGEGKTYEL